MCQVYSRCSEGASPACQGLPRSFALTRTEFSFPSICPPFTHPCKPTLTWASGTIMPFRMPQPMEATPKLDQAAVTLTKGLVCLTGFWEGVRDWQCVARVRFADEVTEGLRKARWLPPRMARESSSSRGSQLPLHPHGLHPHPPHTMHGPLWCPFLTRSVNINSSSVNHLGVTLERWRVFGEFEDAEGQDPIGGGWWWSLGEWLGQAALM